MNRMAIPTPPSPISSPPSGAPGLKALPCKHAVARAVNRKFFQAGGLAKAREGSDRHTQLICLPG